MRLTTTRDVFGRDAAGRGFTLGRLTVTYDGPLAFGVGGWSATNPRGPLDFGYTCEDEDRGMDALDLATLDRKIPKVTCITVNSRGYRVSRTPSDRFKDRCPDGRMVELMGVSRFRGIRCHPGNTNVDTEGCVLPGLQRDTARGTVLYSKPAWEWLDARVHDCDARGEPVLWVIQRDPVAWAAYLAAGGAN